jgi:hypothetical protein
MTDSTTVNVTVNGPAKSDTTLQKLSAALEAGHIKQAHRIKSDFLKDITKSYPREIREKFHLLDVKLKELEDWQRYASNSKRLELCEKMENLKDHNEIHPEEKAKAIKELQNQWQQLGPSDSREGQKLWQRFKLAGDLAFAVCSEYFDGRREHREQNLQERIKICDSLSLFLAENDWQETNWKAVSHIVKTARTEWKQFEDIPHANRKEMHNKFFNALESIEAKIGEEQERNHLLKQGYILQVQSLLETDDVTKMIRETKNVQSAWKQVGITDRGVDQRLWKEFRKLCDASFAKRDEEKVHRDQIHTAEMQRAEELCGRLESLLNNDLQIESFQEVSKEFSVLMSGKKHSLKNRFEQLKKQGVEILKNSDKREAEKFLNELVRKVSLCEQLETGAALEEIDAKWESETILTEDLELLLNNRWERAKSGNYDYADPATAEEICVRMEILAHIDSPDSSQSIRFKLQVERLDLQLSKGIKDDRSKFDQLEALQLRWYSMGPIQHDGIGLKKRCSKAAKAITSSKA